VARCSGITALFVIAMLSLGGCSSVPAEVPVHTAQIQSEPITVDRFYYSMAGPIRHAPMTLRPDGPSELVWLKSVEVTAVTPEGEKLDSQENLCHAQLRSQYTGDEWVRHDSQMFGGTRMLPEKWFALVAGQMKVELPEGFGIPTMTDEPLDAMFMVLNQDPDFVPFDLAVKMTVEYVFDRDLDRPMKSLTKTGFDTIVYSNAAGDTHDHEEGDEHESCSLASGEAAGTLAGQTQGVPTTHWIVPPGRHVYRNDYTLSNSITAHYFSAHLHVFGETIELRDKTTGETVFKSFATPNEKHTTIVDMSDLTSLPGIELHGGRTYELITTYENTTDRNIDAMGVVYMYVANDAFQPPT